MSHSRRIKTSGWCAQYIQELMADLDNIEIWKVEKMQDKEVQGSKSNLNFNSLATGPVKTSPILEYYFQVFCKFHILGSVHAMLFYKMKIPPFDSAKKYLLIPNDSFSQRQTL
jgi:hypothetical protein